MLVLKGFVIGLGKILPGVSGAILAISLGIYGKIFESLYNPNKQNIIYLLKLGIGIILAISIGSNIINYFINKYYLPTTLLFTGMILGSQHEICKKIKKKKHFIITLIAFITATLLTNIKVIANMSIEGTAKYILLGIIESSSTIIPGISGTAIFISLGLYNDILYVLSNILNIKLVLENLDIMIPFIISVITTSLLLGKLINYILQKKESIMYSAILGFSISAILSMIQTTLYQKYTLTNILVSILMLLVGIKITHKPEK